MHYCRIRLTNTGITIRQTLLATRAIASTTHLLVSRYMATRPVAYRVTTRYGHRGVPTSVAATSCYVQGRASGRRGSYAALSICDRGVRLAIASSLLVVLDLSSTAANLTRAATSLSRADINQTGAGIT